MRRLSITLFSLCLASALTAQTTGSNQSVRLRADNIDEVVSAMTLEEKVHLVIGCGMSMGSDTKFPEQRDVLTTFPTGYPFRLSCRRTAPVGDGCQAGIRQPYLSCYGIPFQHHGGDYFQSDRDP